MQIIGKDGKEYKTVAECKEADKAFDALQLEKTKQEDAAKIQQSKERKEYANQIEKIEEDYNSAIQELNRVKKDASKLVADARLEACKMIQEATEYVEKISNAKVELVSEYNRKFNKPYVKYYTGKEAEQEFKKFRDYITSSFSDPFNIFKLF